MATGSWGRSDAVVWTCTYRLLRRDKSLIYVGATDNFESRMYNHSGKHWWPEVASKDVIWFPDRLSALYEESWAIDNESPSYNDRSGLGPVGLQPIRRDGVAPPFVATRWDKDRFFIGMRERDTAEVSMYGEPTGALVVSYDWWQKARAAMGETADLSEVAICPIEIL